MHTREWLLRRRRPARRGARRGCDGFVWLGSGEEVRSGVEYAHNDILDEL